MMSYLSPEPNKIEAVTNRISLHTLNEMRQRGKKITVLTCYDFPTAKIMAECQIPVLLVGDSAVMAVLGEDSTQAATMDYLVTITKAVRKGAPGAFLMGDMPYGSYNTPDEAVKNALRFIKESGVDSVKLECDIREREIIQVLSDKGVTVCAHLGLLPQRAHEMGGYKAQGRTDEEAERIINHAVTLYQAGAKMFLLEAVPDKVSAALRERIDVPLIGCGAGPSCDGHVLVVHDLLGFTAKPARFVEVMADVPGAIREGIQKYRDAVVKGSYPAEKHQYKSKVQQG